MPVRRGLKTDPDICPDPACALDIEWATVWNLDAVPRHGVYAKKVALVPTRPIDPDDTYANWAVSGHSTGRLMARQLRVGEGPLANEHRRVVHAAVCDGIQGDRRQKAIAAAVDAATDREGAVVLPFRQREHAETLI